MSLITGSCSSVVPLQWECQGWGREIETAFLVWFHFIFLILCNSLLWRAEVFLVIPFVDKVAFSEKLSGLPRSPSGEWQNLVRMSAYLPTQGHCLLWWGMWCRRTQEGGPKLESRARNAEPVTFHVHERLWTRWKSEVADGTRGLWRPIGPLAFHLSWMGWSHR